VCLSWFKETKGLHSVRRSRVPLVNNIHVPHPTLVTLEGGNLGNFALPQLFCDGKKSDIFEMWSHRMVKNHFVFCDG
jgi:hypothetical protein